jgi:hypothetical protein
MREAVRLIPIQEDEQANLAAVVADDDDDDDRLADGGIESSDQENHRDWQVDEEVEEALPEAVTLLLPSSLTTSQRFQLKIQRLADQEAQLREGQANDALDSIRSSLAQVSLVFRTQVRNAKSVYTRTRSWGQVQQTNSQVQHHVFRYNTSRNALIKLGAPAHVCLKYLEIRREHLKMPGDIVEANRIGQRSDSLPWFWRLDREKSGTQTGSMKECECELLLQLLRIYLISEIFSLSG